MLMPADACSGVRKLQAAADLAGVQVLINLHCRSPVCCRCSSSRGGQRQRHEYCAPGQGSSWSDGAQARISGTLPHSCIRQQSRRSLMGREGRESGVIAGHPHKCASKATPPRRRLPAGSPSDAHLHCWWSSWSSWRRGGPAGRHGGQAGGARLGGSGSRAAAAAAVEVVGAEEPQGPRRRCHLAMRRADRHAGRRRGWAGRLTERSRSRRARCGGLGTWAPCHAVPARPPRACSRLDARLLIRRVPLRGFQGRHPAPSLVAHRSNWGAVGAGRGRAGPGRWASPPCRIWKCQSPAVCHAPAALDMCLLMFTRLVSSRDRPAACRTE